MSASSLVLLSQVSHTHNMSQLRLSFMSTIVRLLVLRALQLAMVIPFRELRKAWVLTRVNLRCMSAMCGGLVKSEG